MGQAPRDRNSERAAPGGFNEAPANLPGNGRTGMGRTELTIAREKGFNEAPANLPGNGGGVTAFPNRLGYGEASMRPRRICRGMAFRLRFGEVSGSQRRSFNEAPANLPGNGAMYVEERANL